MELLKPTNKLLLTGLYDVIVIEGGIAGEVAALAVRRRRIFKSRN